ncbi:MAG: nitrilase [Deltaproteobacteria bacterium]|nr:nitrilase [Deltaproteobacteria bacterium]MBW1962196.1 nitrilase [Deltaproteobacteria bacterium]MBW2152855.1 nitrilase [Deltaproteobacteria bacterium]
MKDIRIAAAITRCPVGKTRENLDGMVKWVRAAKNQRAHVICFPEMNITGYLNRAEIRNFAEPATGRITERLISLARSEKIIILAGMAEKTDGNCIYASHLVIKPDGTADIYRKVHIAPVEKTIFKPGNRIPVFDINGVKFGIQLCYDAHFPELTTYMALNGADLIFIPHASPRCDPAGKLKSWSRHLPARAYDNAVFVVACNQTGDNEMGLSFPGIAVVIAPSGEIMKKWTSDKEGILLADLTADSLARIRTHNMRYFLPNRRPGLYRLLTENGLGLSVML